MVATAGAQFARGQPFDCGPAAQDVADQFAIVAVGKTVMLQPA